MAIILAYSVTIPRERKLHGHTRKFKATMIFLTLHLIPHQEFYFHHIVLLSLAQEHLKNKGELFFIIAFIMVWRVR